MKFDFESIFIMKQAARHELHKNKFEFKKFLFTFFIFVFPKAIFFLIICQKDNKKLIN